MTIRNEVLKLQQDSLIDLYTLDLTPTGIDTFFYFVSDRDVDDSTVKFNGKSFVAFDLQATGFEATSKAPFPKPTLAFGNVSGTVSSIMLLYNDLVGARVTRTRTYVKYLDGKSEGGHGYEMTREIYSIERVVEESELTVVFELVNDIELEGLTLPRRYITRRCPWIYRSADCSYTGNAMYTKQDVGTGDERLDECSRTIRGCKLRFGQNAELSHGGFPSVDIY